MQALALEAKSTESTNATDGLNWIGSAKAAMNRKSRSTAPIS